MFFAVCLASPTAAMAAGKGYRGGTVVAEEDPPVDTGGIPDTVEGPLNDMMSDAGKLYGDLYVILRQHGVVDDKKLDPAVEADGDPMLNEDGFQQFTIVGNTGALDDPIVGGEPVLTVIDPGDENAYADYGWYAAEIGVNLDETPIYGAAQSPYPARCVQPVASYERWGDISSKTGLTKNRLPLVITYDPTWKRSECAVGELIIPDGGLVVDPNSGVMDLPVNEWFIKPGETWVDPNNGVPVTYPNGVLWTALIGEVHFGRLNLGRSPEAVLQAAFDEAINNINSPDTVAIEIDAAGRLLLTKKVYDELLVDPLTGLPLWIDTVKKAIDSPLENVALYAKLMKDGHLVTPGDERMPIDRSKNGGIPLWKMLELTDGPGAKALRPTIDIDKMEKWGLGSMVDVSEVDYLTYYVCLDDADEPAEVPCLVWGTDPSHEATEVLVGNPAAVSRELRTVVVPADCPNGFNLDNPYDCQGPFTGITTDDDGAPDATDLNFAAAHIAAAGDKTGHMTVDMIVYLNSILGINQVLGYSAYDDDGEPTANAIDYGKNPFYFNYRNVAGYSRNTIFSARGNVTATGGGVETLGASTYDGKVTVTAGSES